MTLEHAIQSKQELEQHVSELEQRIRELEEKLAAALVQVDWLQKQLFGQGKSERQDALQLQLQLGEAMAAVQQVQEELKETIQYERSKPGKPAPERVLPKERFANVPVGETIELIPDEVKAAPELYRKINVEETFEIDIQPPKVFKRVILRPRFVLIEDRSLSPVVAPAPKRIIENSYASAGLIAWVVVSKYLDHLPLYRQEKIFNRYQVYIARQRMCDWIAHASQMIDILYRRMKLELLAGGYVHIDETPVKFIDPDEKKRQNNSRVFLGHDRTERIGRSPMGKNPQPGDHPKPAERLSRRGAV